MQTTIDYEDFFAKFYICPVTFLQRESIEYLSADSTTISNNDIGLAMRLLISATCFKLFFRRFYLAALLIGPVAMIALLLQAPVLFAQISGERQLEFEQFTVNDGLSQNFVTRTCSCSRSMTSTKARVNLCGKELASA